MLMPAESCAASPTTSLRLGWGWTFVPISQTEALRKRANAASAISSPPWWPRIWTPRTSPESASYTSFTKPSVSLWMRAILLDGQLDDAVVDARGFGLHAGGGEDGGAAGGEQLFDAASEVAVLQGEQPWQRLDDGDLRAHVQVERYELQPDRSGADDGDRLRDLRQFQAVVAGQDALAVRLQAGKRLRARAGSEQAVRRADAAAAGLDLGWGEEPRVALDDLDLVLLDEGAQALVQGA